jgi:hypothetical protein
MTGQGRRILKNSFRLENSVYQNGSTFEFWRGITDSSKSRILIERIKNRADTILFDGFVRDGVYKVNDANKDGYKDFVLYYHDYDAIYFFDKKKNNFSDIPVYLPKNSGVVTLGTNVYWGYRDAQYSEKYDYSILYKYIGCNPYYYYKIVYKTAKEDGDRTHGTKIELYKFKQGEYEKPIFVKEIKTKNPSRFDYKKYWKENYRQLMGHR